MPALSLNVKGGVWMQKLEQAAAIALLKPILSCSIAKVGHQGGLLHLYCGDRCKFYSFGGLSSPNFWFIGCLLKLNADPIELTDKHILGEGFIIISLNKRYKSVNYKIK